MAHPPTITRYARAGTILPWTNRYLGWNLFRTSPITSATATASPSSGLTLATPTVASTGDEAGKVVSCVITCTTAGTYNVTITPLTAEGYTDPYTFTLIVEA